MKQPSAFQGTYSDWRLIKTRAVVQVIFEVPLADADAAYDVLGGMPVHGKERWFGIAALKSTAEEARAKPDQVSPPDSRPDRASRHKMNWRDMQPAAQAGIRCAEPIFWTFLREEQGQAYVNSEEQASEYIRGFCAVKSRAELSTNHKARVMWKMLDDEFSAWRVLERT